MTLLMIRKQAFFFSSDTPGLSLTHEIAADLPGIVDRQLEPHQRVFVTSGPLDISSVSAADRAMCIASARAFALL